MRSGVGYYPARADVTGVLAIAVKCWTTVPFQYTQGFRGAIRGSTDHDGWQAIQSLPIMSAERLPSVKAVDLRWC